MFNLIDRESQDNNLQLHYNHYKTVGFFIHKMFLTEFDTHYEFNDLQLYQTRYNLYPNRIDDPFFGEKCFDCIGTGVAITKRHILTPLHVIRGFIVNEETLHDYVFIMGCQINEVNKNRILKSQVFELEKIVFKPDFMNKSDINDICIIRVLKEIEEDHIVTLDPQNLELLENDDYYSLGYPLGLAMKQSYNENHFFGGYYENCFRTFLDAYEKNSGSPVFRHKEAGLVGIVIEAGFGEDFVEDESHPGYLKKAIFSSEEIGIENGTKVLKIERIIERISQLITDPKHAQADELDYSLLKLFYNPKPLIMTSKLNAGIVRNFEILKKKNSNSKRLFEIKIEIDSSLPLKTLNVELFDVELDENDNEASRMPAIETIKINNQAISILINKIKHNPIKDLYSFTKALTISENGIIVFDAYIFSYKINTKPGTQGDVIKIKTP